jgi:diguanylate cyclase (GGDEF)-like protein/PAS domain S-box-containing protein
MAGWTADRDHCTMRPVPDFRQGRHPDEIRILMLEDDAAFAELVRAHLDRVAWARITLEWTNTLAGALERLARESFDLILSDLHVPDSGGLETLESLSRASDRLIIAVTGERADNLRESAIEHGAYDLVAKDHVDRIELERLVRLGAMQANTFRSLRESEARFRSLVTQSWDWYWEQDEALRYTRFEGRSSESAQAEFDKAIGCRRWEIPGLVPVSSTWEEHRAKLEARRKFRDFEYSWRRDDGPLRYMSVRGEPVFDAGGAFRGYRGVATDITQRKQAEAARLRLERAHAALNAANEVILQAKSPEELFERACAIAVQAGGFLISNIFVMDADGAELSCVASNGPRAGLGRSVKQSADASQPGGQGLIGLACRTRVAVISNDYQNDSRTSLRGTWRGAPVGSVGIFPLFAEGRLAGAFAVQHEKANAINEELASLVQRLADNVSLALGNFRREEAVRESEERFRQLTELWADWYWEQDENFRFTRVSAGPDSAVTARSLGKARWELPGFELVHGTWEQHRALLERHEPYRDLQMRRRQPDGSLRHVSVSGQPVFDEAGTFKGYRGTTRDITRNVQAEEELRRFRVALDNSADMILLIDPAAMRYVDANATACRLLGYSREELLALGPHDVLPVCRAQMEKSYAALLAGSAAEGGMNSYYLCKDGSRLPFESTRHILRSGDRWLIAAISRDIRERIATNAALRDSEGRFRALTELSSDGFWEQDAEYRFTSITSKDPLAGSDAYRPMIGKRRWDLPYFNMTGADWDTHRVLLEARLPFQDLELARVADNGEQVWMSISGGPVFDAGGRFKGYCGVAKNISARKREERLLTLEHSVARELTDAKSMVHALPAVMASICRMENWQCCRYFQLDESAGKMRLRESWTDGSDAMLRFVNASAGLAYGKEDGLVGHVWRTGEPLWVEDASNDPRVAMKSLAQGAGLHGALIVPVTFEGPVMGVLSISSTKVKSPDDRLLRTLRLIGAQMGQFLQRKQAEQELRESEARFRSLTSLSSDFFWQTDVQHRINEVAHGPRHSPILERAAGKARWDLPFTYPDAAGWARHKATMEGRQPFRDFEFGRIDGKGLERHLSISGEPIFGSDGSFLGYRGVGRDITDRKRAEQGLKLEHTVTRALADADSAAAALKAVMRCVCEIEGWECGRYFGRDDSDVFRLSESWHPPNPELEQFITYSTEKAFPLGIGIVGRAGAGEPQWVADTMFDARVVSRPMASEHGMRAAFMFPVTSQGRSLGVLSFTSREIREPDERLLKAVRVIGSQIGQFLSRKHAEQALGEEEARFRQTFELSASGMAHVALDGTYLRVNRRLCQIVGYSEDELIRRTAKDVSHPEDRDVMDEPLDRLRRGEVPSVRREKRYVRKDGSVVWVELSVAVVRSAEGEPQYEISVYDDITERKQAEEALRESELRFRNLSELSSDWFWEQDEELRFTKLYGNARLSDSMIGKRRWESPGVDPASAEWREHIEKLERRERFRDFEYSHLGQNGRRVHVRASGYPLFDAEGRFTGYRGLARNVTRQRESKEELRRFRTALDSSADMMMLVDVKTLALLDFNETTCYYLGYERQELLGVGSDVIVCGVAPDAMRASLEDLSARKDASDLTVRTYRRKDGTTFEVEVLRRIVGSPDGAILVLNARDLTERRRAEERQAAHLRYQECTARFGHLALSKHEAGALIDDAVLSVHEALQTCALAYVERGAGEGQLMLRGGAGLPKESDFASQAPHGAADAISGTLDYGEVAVIHDAGSAGGPLRFEWAAEFQSMVAVPVHGGGEVRGALCALSKGTGELGPEESKFLTAAASVLSAGLLRIESEERLVFLAQFDVLTGLPNRALLRDRFSQMIVQARRHASTLGVLFIDIDDFKLVNDSLGHAGGDELLKETAARLQAAVRPGDTVARISGDEFAVILGDLARADDAAIVAQKIIDRLAAPLQVLGQEVFITASIGIAAFPADGHDAAALLAAADAAMYRAKQSGRNSYHFFTADINQRTRARAQIGSELRRALERNELEVYYQPKFDLRSGRPCATEALLRWRHPERGLVSPAEFVPILEETGLIVQVGEMVLRRACENLKSWAAAGMQPMPVAVNLSARQFRLQDLDARILRQVREGGVDPSLIELEITESQLMQDPDHAKRIIRALSNAGIRVAIDDFGTGYSSLSYLTRFPVSALKIDRSFVADVLSDEADAAIVRTIIDMAHTLGFIVVAEGVETEAQATLLRSLGCEQAQGYYFARPMPEADFRVLMSSFEASASAMT